MIEVSQVARSFVGQTVLRSVSFQVEAAKTYVVLGQSGVGKSVLLKVLAGLLSPDEGHVRIGTRSIGMLFQKNALFDSFTVRENLEFPLREKTPLKAADRSQKISQFLDWVGLSGTENLFPSELSGGMQKRLGIARALIVEPEVILYDEPTAGLDPITSRMIIELIMRLRNQLGTTVVTVTSDVLRAYQMADCIGLLVKGPHGATLLEAGSPDQTRNSPDASIQQFIKGLTKGPLTSALDEIYYERKTSLAELCAELDNDPF